MLGERFDRPVVLSARGTDINLFPRFPRIRKHIESALDRADGVIAVCQALKDEMARLGLDPDDISVITNGVDHSKFHPVDRAAARKRLGLGDRRTLLSVGNLSSRKGFDFLIRGFDIMRRSHGITDTELVIVGEGEERRELERLISDRGLEERVQLAGDVPHDSLRDWYNAADLFCLMSDREGFPNVLLEAMACGTPVVATRIWGVPEIVTSDSLGLMTEREDRAIATTGVPHAIASRCSSARSHREVAARARGRWSAPLGAAARPAPDPPPRRQPVRPASSASGCSALVAGHRIAGHRGAGRERAADRSRHCQMASYCRAASPSR